jgi:hypothetical protein
VLPGRASGCEPEQLKTMHAMTNVGFTAMR